MKTKIPPLAVVASALSLSACIGGAAKVGYMKEKGAPLPSFVAILPPENESTDVAAPDTTRRAIAELLLTMGIVPFHSPAQDEQLKALGITDGGHLKNQDPAKLAKALGVDGLVYSTIHQFRDVNVAVYVNRMVDASVRLVDGTGERLFEIDGNGYYRQVNISPTSIATEAIKAGAAHAATSQLEKMLKIHLLDEAQRMAGNMRKSLPEWPSIDVASKPAGDAAGKAKK